METTSITIENLNDLIRIHNDRIAGYEHALNELQQDDAELKQLFTNLISESHQFKMELGTEVGALGGDMESNTSESGKIHRALMSLKEAFGGNNKTLLENCEYGEDITQKAYKSALEDEYLPAYLQQMLVRQQSILKAAHDKVKALRDSR